MGSINQFLDTIASMTTPALFPAGLLVIEVKNDKLVWMMFRIKPYKPGSTEDTWCIIERTPQTDDSSSIQTTGLATFKNSMHGYEFIINPDTSRSTIRKWAKWNINVTKDMLTPIRSSGTIGGMNMFLLEFGVINKIDGFGILTYGCQLGLSTPVKANQNGTVSSLVDTAQSGSLVTGSQMVRISMCHNEASQEIPVNILQGNTFGESRLDIRTLALPTSLHNKIFHKNKLKDVTHDTLTMGKYSAYYVSYMDAWVFFDNNGVLQQSVPVEFKHLATRGIASASVKKGKLHG